MALKLRLAIGLALFAGTLTLVISIVHENRTMTVLYRAIISTAVFGICGYIYGVLVEQYLPMLLKFFASTEAVAEEELKEEQTSATTLTAAEEEINDNAAFVPLNPEKIENIPRSPE